MKRGVDIMISANIFFDLVMGFASAFTGDYPKGQFYLSLAILFSIVLFGTNMERRP